MRVVIIGLGVQGQKRRRIAGDHVVATVDPWVEDADHRDIGDVPLDGYDAALVCTPDEAKLPILQYLATHGKHALVEKPLLAADDSMLETLAETAARQGAVCYTAYNHRFEPHFVRMRELLASGVLGEIYAFRMFYGNGTARLVRDSRWRDQAAGVLPDLGSHLLDTLRFWLGDAWTATFDVRGAFHHENRSLDHVLIGSNDGPAIQLEMTLLSWRNHFTCDVLAERGSAHIDSLCKWGPSTFTRRDRVLPSGRPPEEAVTLVQPDPTWAAEWEYFCDACERGEGGNIANDLWINSTLRQLAAEAGVDTLLPTSSHG